MVNGLQSAEFAAVADTSDLLLNGLGENMPGVATYRDYERMLDERALDAVFITSPTHLHVPMAMACAERGLPFFVEKPLGTSAAGVRPLVEAVSRSPVTNMVGYMGRDIDSFRHARGLLESRTLGRLIHFRATMYVSQLFKPGKGWRYEKEKSGGGVLITQNSHLIDLLRWYFGPVAWVSGQTKSWYSKSVDDFAHAYLGFESGLTGYLDTSWSMRHYRTVEIAIEVEGEGGTLTVNDDQVKLFLDEPQGDRRSGWSTWRKPDLFRPVEVDVGGPQYTHQDARFLEAVASRGQVENDVSSAYRVQEILDAIYESSAAGGKRVTVGEGGSPWR